MAFQFELRTNGPQSNLIAQYAGARRFVFNKALDAQIKHYEATGKKLSYADLCNRLTVWKTESQNAWLSQIPSQSLQQALKDLDQAYTNFFKKRADFPQFKKKGKSRESFRYPQGFKVNEGERRIFLPKIGWVRYYQSRNVIGIIKNITVSMVVGRCFVSIQTEHDVPAPQTPTGEPVGLDEGIAKFSTLSNGQAFDPLNAQKKWAKKIAKAQKGAARKQKGSKNKAKANRRTAKLKRKEANERKDYLHKLSTQLSKNHALIVVENLKIDNMTKSAKGTIENPGKYVRQKSGLNRSILDQGWGEFVRQLEYKLKWNGGELIRVDPRHTSQECSGCGHTCPENRKSQAHFECVACGLKLNADINAAINILNRGMNFIATRGHRGLACRDTLPVRAMAQETTEDQTANAA